MLDDWKALTCSERKETGKALENKSVGRTDTSIKATFDYKDGEIKALEFSKAYPRARTNFPVLDVVKEKIQDPFNICNRDK